MPQWPNGETNSERERAAGATAAKGAAWEAEGGGGPPNRQRAQGRAGAGRGGFGPWPASAATAWRTRNTPGANARARRAARACKPKRSRPVPVGTARLPPAGHAVVARRWLGPGERAEGTAPGACGGPCAKGPVERAGPPRRLGLFTTRAQASGGERTRRRAGRPHTPRRRRGTHGCDQTPRERRFRRRGRPPRPVGAEQMAASRPMECRPWAPRLRRLRVSTERCKTPTGTRAVQSPWVLPRTGKLCLPVTKVPPLMSPWAGRLTGDHGTRTMHPAGVQTTTCRPRPGCPRGPTG